MNTKTKRRLVAVTGVIIIVLVVILAVVGGSGAAKTITVTDAAEGGYAGQRVQVTGNVVDNSFSTVDGVLKFQIFDPEGDASKAIAVEYDGAAASTFGNGVTAICTGTMSDDGKTLVASELVTKCPSKYESATDALTVSKLIGYGEDIVGKPVKVAATVKAGTLGSAVSSDVRFVAVDADDASVELPVVFDGALADAITDGTSVVISGSLTSDGKFEATDVAQEG